MSNTDGQTKRDVTSATYNSQRAKRCLLIYCSIGCVPSPLQVLEDNCQTSPLPCFKGQQNTGQTIDLGHDHLDGLKRTVAGVTTRAAQCRVTDLLGWIVHTSHRKTLAPKHFGTLQHIKRHLPIGLIRKKPGGHQQLTLHGPAAEAAGCQLTQPALQGGWVQGNRAIATGRCTASTLGHRCTWYW